MKQDDFERAYEHHWLAFEHWLEASKGSSATQPGSLNAQQVPAAYRRLCQHLSIARDRVYSSALTDRLNNLVLQGHQRLYGARGGDFGRFLDFLVSGFAQEVRAQAGIVWVGAALLFVPMIALIAVLQFYPDVALFFTSSSQLSGFEQMYAPANKVVGKFRDADSQFMMFCYYIWNNVKIDFQCFAGGLLFGVGSVFFMVYNGISIGTVAGHLTHVGYIETFWGFVAGHSAFELVGAAISGASGLRLGWALISPGNLSRVEALKQASIPAIRLLYGAAIMTTAAAFIEGFWSSNTIIPFKVKIAVGITLWVLTLSYFLFAGRKGRLQRAN